MIDQHKEFISKHDLECAVKQFVTPDTDESDWSRIVRECGMFTEGLIRGGAQCALQAINHPNKVMPEITLGAATIGSAALVDTFVPRPVQSFYKAGLILGSLESVQPDFPKQTAECMVAAYDCGLHPAHRQRDTELIAKTAPHLVADALTIVAGIELGKHFRYWGWGPISSALVLHGKFGL
jgi:hypothetical protein